jgi:hypothetical protein
MLAGTVYVRARNHPNLREAVAASGKQNALAARVGISPVRLSQVLKRPSTVIPVAVAAAIEDALGAPRGHHFALVDTALTAPYAVELDGPAELDGAAA